MFWIIAGIAAAALVLSLLTFQDAPPADRSATRNPLPVGLAAAGCVALFYGSSELLTHSFLDAVTLVPQVGGLALIVILLVYQYRARRPLLCIRPLGSTLPVSGIVVAMCAAAIPYPRSRWPPSCSETSSRLFTWGCFSSPSSSRR